MDSVVDTAPADGELADRPTAITTAPEGPTFRSWLLKEAPYIAMLSLALIGITFHLPLTYWMVLTQALSWGALVLAIIVLYDDGAQGVLNANGSSLAMITLLALGTFLAGLQAEVWRTCGVGVILFLSVPAIGWLQQSSILLVVGTLGVLAVGGATWYLSRGEPAHV